MLYVSEDFRTVSLPDRRPGNPCPVEKIMFRRLTPSWYARLHLRLRELQNSTTPGEDMRKEIAWMEKQFETLTEKAVRFYGKETLEDAIEAAEIIRSVGTSHRRGNALPEHVPAQTETDEWTAFVNAWWSRFEDSHVRICQLNQMCEDHSLLISKRGTGNLRSKHSRLGIVLAKMHNQVVDGKRIVKVARKTKHNGSRYFRLMNTSSSEQ